MKSAVMVDDDGYKKVFKSDESLAIFLKNMAKFDRHFCEAMATGVDFTISLEVHGNVGQMVHCCVKNAGWERPKKVSKELGQKSSQRPSQRRP